MSLLWIQLGELTDTQRAVRDHFTRGGSIVQVLVVILAVAAVFVLAVLLANRQRSSGRADNPNDPQRLFRQLLGRLELPTPHRKLLIALANNLRLENPTVLLLSRAVYDRAVEQWEQGHQADGETSKPAIATPYKQIRERLFPGAPESSRQKLAAESA